MQLLMVERSTADLHDHKSDSVLCAFDTHALAVVEYRSSLHLITDLHRCICGVGFLLVQEATQLILKSIDGDVSKINILVHHIDPCRPLRCFPAFSQIQLSGESRWIF